MDNNHSLDTRRRAAATSSSSLFAYFACEHALTTTEVMTGPIDTPSVVAKANNATSRWK